MQWSAVWIHDREAMTQAIAQFNPDMVLVDVAKPNGRDWWQEGRAQLAAEPTLLVNWELEDAFFSATSCRQAEGFGSAADVFASGAPLCESWPNLRLRELFGVCARKVSSFDHDRIQNSSRADGR